MPLVLPPTSSLNVFEPLASFSIRQQASMSAQLATGMTRADVEEQLRAEAAQRLLHPGGNPFPVVDDDLALPLRHEGAWLFCPVQTSLRSSLAAQRLLEEADEDVARVLLPAGMVGQDMEARERDEALGKDPRVHTQSAVWGVPLTWFTAFSASDHEVVLEQRPDPRPGARRHLLPPLLTVRRYTTVSEASERVRRAARVLEDVEGLEPLAGHAGSLGLWLDQFNGRGMVELDYGPVADMVHPDDSPEDVAEGIEALAEGDATAAAAAYNRLTRRWMRIKQFAGAS